MEKEGKIDTLIGKDTVIKGDLRSSGSVKIDGQIEGNIAVKESIVIGKDAMVKGNSSCRNAIIGGKIQGNIEAQELLEYQSGAQMVGDITCKGLIVQEGVLFEGNCRMAQKPREKD
jgi:cytoskeletal protein CcmA (bactofilin family)